MKVGQGGRDSWDSPEKTNRFFSLAPRSLFPTLHFLLTRSTQGNSTSHCLYMPNCQTLRLRFPRYRGYRTGPKRWDDHNQKSTKKLRKSRSWDLHWRVLLNSPATRRERVMSHRWVISCRCVHQSREPVVSSAQAVMRERERKRNKNTWGLAGFFRRRFQSLSCALCLALWAKAHWVFYIELPSQAQLQGGPL